MQDVPQNWDQVMLAHTRLDLKQLLIAVANNSHVGLIIRDKSLRCLYVNEALARINGLSPNKYLGKRLGDIIGDAAAAIEPHYAEVLATGKPIFNREISAKFPARPEISHLVGTYFPLKDRQGRVREVAAVVVEVTAEKKHELLSRKLERLEALQYARSPSGLTNARNPSTPVLLRSWKEIASFLGTSVRTVQRWESEYHLPVRRLPNSKGASVFGFADELRTWLISTVSAADCGGPVRGN